ncbi:MAG: hypothetical protein ACYTG0_20110, partial [Planctomycetota bacterium]
MRRQIYPVLLLTTVALTAAVYMRPSVGEELLSLMSGGAGPETRQSSTSLQSIPYPDPVGHSAPPTSEIPHSQPVPWRATPVVDPYEGPAPTRHATAIGYPVAA